MRRVFLLLCSLACSSFACIDKVWEFGQDTTDSILVARETGQLSLLQRDSSITFPVFRCVLINFVQVSIYNLFSTPAVTFDASTNTVFISNVFMQPSAATYKLIAKGRSIPNCKSNPCKNRNNDKCGGVLKNDKKSRPLWIIGSTAIGNPRGSLGGGSSNTMGSGRGSGSCNHSAISYFGNGNGDSSDSGHRNSDGNCAHAIIIKQWGNAKGSKGNGMAAGINYGKNYKVEGVVKSDVGSGVGNGPGSENIATDFNRDNGHGNKDASGNDGAFISHSGSESGTELSSTFVDFIKGAINGSGGSLNGGLGHGNGGLGSGLGGGISGSGTGSKGGSIKDAVSGGFDSGISGELGSFGEGGGNSGGMSDGLGGGISGGQGGAGSSSAHGGGGSGTIGASGGGGKGVGKGGSLGGGLVGSLSGSLGGVLGGGIYGSLNGGAIGGLGGVGGGGKIGSIGGGISGALGGGIRGTLGGGFLGGGLSGHKAHFLGGRVNGFGDGIMSDVNSVLRNLYANRHRNNPDTENTKRFNIRPREKSVIYWRCYRYPNDCYKVVHLLG